MKMRKIVPQLCWLLPLALHAGNAHAWGLVTHVYFAHSLLWAMPLLDPRLRNAIQRFPELVMTGACLPDLGLVAKEFRQSHQWQRAHDMLETAETDEHLAIAIGYASHLYVDVIAHNHFVPAHEAMWEEDSMATHIASEWAMDAYLRPKVILMPTQLLRRNKQLIAEFLSPFFDAAPERTLLALNRLANADRILRISRLPGAIYRTMKLADRRMPGHFVYYISQTHTALRHIGFMLGGISPEWQAELKQFDIPHMLDWRRQCLAHVQLNQPTPIDYYSSGSTSGTEH